MRITSSGLRIPPKPSSPLLAVIRKNSSICFATCSPSENIAGAGESPPGPPAPVLRFSARTVESSVLPVFAGTSRGLEDPPQVLQPPSCGDPQELLDSPRSDSKYSGNRRIPPRSSGSRLRASADGRSSRPLAKDIEPSCTGSATPGSVSTRRSARATTPAAPRSGRRCRSRGPPCGPLRPRSPGPRDVPGHADHQDVALQSPGARREARCACRSRSMNRAIDVPRLTCSDSAQRCLCRPCSRPLDDRRAICVSNAAADRVHSTNTLVVPPTGTAGERRTQLVR